MCFILLQSIMDTPELFRLLNDVLLDFSCSYSNFPSNWIGFHNGYTLRCVPEDIKGFCTLTFLGEARKKHPVHHYTSTCMYFHNGPTLSKCLPVQLLSSEALQNIIPTIILLSFVTWGLWCSCDLALPSTLDLVALSLTSFPPLH